MNPRWRRRIPRSLARPPRGRTRTDGGGPPRDPPRLRRLFHARAGEEPQPAAGGDLPVRQTRSKLYRRALAGDPHGCDLPLTACLNCDLY